MASFQVQVSTREEVHTLPGTWQRDELRKVLELADADDIGEIVDGDLEDMCLMSLQDAGKQRAGEIVLEAVFGDSVRPGVRQNLVNDLEEDQPWNDFADISKQRGIFIAVCLLHKAFPTRYGTPDAIRVTLNLAADSHEGLTAIDPAKPAGLVRLVACGLEPDSFVHRLYEDELRAGPFADAAGLIWEAVLLDAAGAPEQSRVLSVTASSQLLGSLRAGQEFKAVVPR